MISPVDRYHKTVVFCGCEYITDVHNDAKLAVNIGDRANNNAMVAEVQEAPLTLNVAKTLDLARTRDEGDECDADDIRSMIHVTSLVAPATRQPEPGTLSSTRESQICTRNAFREPSS